MKKKICCVIILICVFIVSIMPVSSSGKVYDSIAGIYPISGLSGSANIEVFGLFSYDNELYNIMTVYSTSVYFYRDGKSISKNIRYDSIPADKSNFIIYFLSIPASTLSSSYDQRLVTLLEGKKIGNIDSVPVISYKYNFVGKWILKNSLDLSSVPSKTYGFVNWYGFNNALNQTSYQSNLTILSNSSLVSYYKDTIEYISFYYSNKWQVSWGKTVNITDSYFITDEAAEVFYNWLCNNAVSYNDGPVPDPTVPPDTQPPDTQPPDTQPPDTQPPDTQPPDTDTPVIPPADRFGFQEMMTGLSYSLFGNGGLVVQIWSWLVSPAVLPFFGIGIALALLLLAILIVKRTF